MRRETPEQKCGVLAGIVLAAMVVVFSYTRVALPAEDNVFFPTYTAAAAQEVKQCCQTRPQLVLEKADKT